MSDIEEEPDLNLPDDDSDDVKPIDMVAEPVPEKEDPGLYVEPEDEVRNIVKKGDYIDLLAAVPSMKEMSIGAGWEMKNMEGDKIDADLCCFLLDKDGQTRVDDDFVFYNQEATLEGAVKHMGDSRTGDGEGDDEEMFFDINGIPFDVIRIALVLSIYDEELKGWDFSMIKDLYLRLVNREEGDEILRVRFDEEELRGQTAIQVACIVREGPKWFFEVQERLVGGGLAALAKEYGIIVREDTG